MFNFYTLFWVCVIILFTIIEAVSITLFGVCFVIGAVCSLLIALLGFTSFYVQLFVFAAVSIASVIVIKPILMTKLKSKEDTRTNVDTVIGANGIVLNEINNVLGTGVVKVLGKEWSAKSLNGDILPISTNVTIVRVEGVKLIVKS